MLLRLHHQLRPSWFGRRFLMVWAALVVGFNLLLRGGEISAVKWEAVNLYEQCADPLYVCSSVRLTLMNWARFGVYTKMDRFFAHGLVGKGS